VTPSEYARLKNQVPRPEDKGPVWDAKADALERTTRGLNKRMALLASGVPASALDQIPIEQLADTDTPDASSSAATGRAGPVDPATGFTIERH
jgi:hypothetical protein